MQATSLLKCAATAAILLAASAALAKGGTHPSESDDRPVGSSMRSFQSLPSVYQPYYRPDRSENDEKIAEAAASPPYCSGNKYGIYRGNGEKNGNGRALTCAKSPG